MIYIYQFGIIILVTFIGEIIYNIVPLPIPASIYGLIIMLFCLQSKIIKLERIKEVGEFLLEIMPLMFIPAAVGLLTVWEEVNNIFFPLVIVIILTTIIVMVTTGRITQFVMKHRGGNNERDNM